MVEDHLHMIMPYVVQLFDSPDVRVKAVTTLAQLARGNSELKKALCQNLYPDETENEQQEKNSSSHTILSPTPSQEAFNLMVNKQCLQQAWESLFHSRKEDWIQWMCGFSTSILHESPSSALQSVRCRVLFDPGPLLGMMYCYGRLWLICVQLQNKESLVKTLEKSSKNNSTTLEVDIALLPRAHIAIYAANADEIVENWPTEKV